MLSTHCRGNQPVRLNRFLIETSFAFYALISKELTPTKEKFPCLLEELALPPLNYPQYKTGLPDYS
jgi:hypothetical protein